MEIHDFRSFRAVAEELSFSKAARKLHVAGSPLSRRIAKLEHELGITLFNRTTRSVTLTDAGRYMYDQVTHLQEALERATTIAQRIHQGASGTVTVGFSGSATYEVVPRIVRTFSTDFPSAVIDVVGEMDSHRQIEALAMGRLSVGFVRDIELPEGISSARVFSEELVVILPEHHPLAHDAHISVASLRDDSFIGFTRQTDVARAVEVTCRRAGFEPRTTARAKESFALSCMVAAGLGVGLAPAAARRLAVDGIAIRPLTPGESEEVHLNMAWAPEQSSPIVESFRRIALGTTWRSVDCDHKSNNRRLY